MKEKPLFTAYEAWPERIYLLYMACFLPWTAFALGWNMWDGRLEASAESILLAAVLLLLAAPCLLYAFKPRTRVYASGVKVAGYPFFAWQDLTGAQFAYVTDARARLSPDRELELLPAPGVTFRTSVWRRLFLRTEYNTRIWVPLWSLAPADRTRLLTHLRARLPAPNETVLRADERTRLFLRGLFFVTMDAFFLLAAAAGGYLVWAACAA